MATKKAKKTTAATSYDPTAVTSYPSQGAFNRQVNQMAQQQLAPTLSDIAARRRQEMGAHTTRVGDIGGIYNFDLQARQAAQDRLQGAVTSILNRGDTLGAGSAEGLAAALRNTAGINDTAAQQLGVQGPAVDPNVGATLAAYNKGDAMGLSGDALNYLARGAADIGITGVEQAEAGRNEAATNKANLDELTQEQTAANAQLPGLRTTAQQNLLSQLLANKQQALAQSQFGESVINDKAQRAATRAQTKLGQDTLSEQTRSAKANESETNRANLANEANAVANTKLDAQRVKTERAQLRAQVQEATDKTTQDQAKATAKQFDNAVDWLTGYLKPTDLDYHLNGDGKKVFSTTLYNRRINFNDALDQLMQRFGMSSLQAYQVLGTSTIPAWRRKAADYAQGYQAGADPTQFPGPH